MFNVDNQLPREIPVSRSPLSDITNASQNKSSRFRSLNTGSSETNIESTTRNLYRDSFENEEQSKKYFNHDDIGTTLFSACDCFDILKIWNIW
mgnify:CR=1 FL=1